MSILELLGLERGEAERTDRRTESVQHIVDALRGLDRSNARFVASFAYIIGRVAHADLDILARCVTPP